MNINFPRQCGFDLSMDELIHSCRGVRNLRGNLFTTLLVLVAKVSTPSIIRSIIKRSDVSLYLENLKGNIFEDSDELRVRNDLRNLNSLLFNYHIISIYIIR